MAIVDLVGLCVHAMGCQEYVETLAKGAIIVGMEIDRLASDEEVG